MTAQGAIDAIVGVMRGMPDPVRQWGSSTAFDYASTLGTALGRAVASVGLWAFVLAVTFGVAALVTSALERR